MTSSTSRSVMTSKFLQIEPLEARIAPAFVLHFLDADGDVVKVAVSAGEMADADLVFDASGTQLQKLGLNDPSFIDANVSISAKPRVPGADGRADLGWLEMKFAPGETRAPSLGSVRIDGDLGKVTVGSVRVIETEAYRDRLVPDLGPGIQVLNIGSIGLLGTTTGAPDLLTEIQGDVGRLSVSGDFQDAQFQISGKLDRLSIGGDLIGSEAGFSGSILTGREIVRARVEGDLEGGAGSRSGAIFSGENFGGLWVKGSLRGGTGAQSGHMDALRGDIGFVRVDGALVGRGLESGAVGSVLFRAVVDGGGGAALSDGGYFQRDLEEPPTNVGSVMIGGNIRGAGILSPGTMQSVQVSGSLFGARILSNGPGQEITIRGRFEASEITSGSLDRLAIGGDVLGREGVGEATISIFGSLRHLFIGGDFRTASATVVSSLTTTGGLTETLKIRGDVDGALIQIGDLENGMIGGDLRGGSSRGAGSFTANTVGSLTVAGSMIAGTAPLTGHVVFGEIRELLWIGGDLQGQESFRATISGLSEFGATPKMISIGGSVRYGDLLFESFTRVGEIVVHGDWLAGNLAIGIGAGADALFGTADDSYLQNDPTTILPLLGRLTIGGRILGTAASTDSFGILAGRIGELIIAGEKRTLTPGAGNDDFSLGSTGDLRFREISRV